MFPKRLLAFTLFAALAVMPPCVLRAQWQPTNSIHLGHIHTAVTDGKTIFDSYNDNLYRSTDQGQSWIRTGFYEGLLPCLIATDGIHIFAFGGYSNLYIWSNDSQNWKPLSHLECPTAFFAKDSVLFVGADSAIRRSTDGGLTWPVIDSGLPPPDRGNNDYVTGFAAIDSFVFVSMTMNPIGIYRSSNNGSTWIPVDSGLSSAGVYNLATQGKNLLAGTDLGFCRSTDLGITWKNIGNGLPNQETDLVDCIGNTIFVDFIGDGGLYYSTDTGATWHTPTSIVALAGITSFTSNADTLYAGGSGGEFMSLDTGRTWTFLNEGAAQWEPGPFLGMGDTLYALDLWPFRSIDSGKNWKIAANNFSVDSDRSIEYLNSLASLGPNLYLGSGGVFLSTDGGDDWVTRSNGLPHDGVPSIVTKDSTLFAGTTQSGVFLSRDSGASWVPCSNGLPALFVLRSLCTTKNSVIVGTTYYGVYLSMDEGNSWVYHGTPMHDITTLAATNSLVFALGDGGLFRSAVNDTTWVNIAPLNGSENDITSILLIDSTVIIGTGSGVFVSSDDGNTWSNHSGGLTNLSVESLAVFNSELVAGLYRVDPSIPAIWRRPISELARSDDSLAASADTLDFGTIPVGKDSLRSMTLHNVGLLPLMIGPFQLTPGQTNFTTSDLSSDVDLHPGESFTFEVFFRPLQAGAFSANLEIGSEAKTLSLAFTGRAYADDEVTQQPDPTSLLTMYPNPFSQSTQITFSSQSAGYAEVSILNMLGVEVTRLFSGELGAGEHSFTWDAGKDACTTGMYECLVRMNGQMQTLPVALMR